MRAMRDVKAALGRPQFARYQQAALSGSLLLIGHLLPPLRSNEISQSAFIIHHIDGRSGVRIIITIILFPHFIIARKDLNDGDNTGGNRLSTIGAPVMCCGPSKGSK